MNRHQRRAAKAQGKRLDPIVAMHEAGHAVARVLSAPDFGMPAEQMVSHIDVGTEQNLGQSLFDKSIMLRSQAVTYGPTFSAELQAVFDRTTQGIDPNTLTNGHIREAITIARDEGVNVTGWLRARMLISTLGPVAEAKFARLQIWDVWDGPQSEDDSISAVKYGVLAGLPTDQVEVLIDEALEQSRLLLMQTNVLRAIVAIANALPITGRLEGKRAVSIITRALAIN